VGPNEVSVDLVEGGTATLKAKNIMIATGSEVAPLPGVPVDEDK
jgi:dihydrolipoamide dehydrogenase